jgi:hypothetical protein
MYVPPRYLLHFKKCTKANFVRARVCVCVWVCHYFLSLSLFLLYSVKNSDYEGTLKYQNFLDILYIK